MRYLLVLGALLTLTACVDRSYTPTVPEALNIGSNFTVFAATSRSADENGYFGFGRSEMLRMLELTVSIPPKHKPGSLKFGYARPNPEKEFTMAARKEFESSSAFKSRISDSIRGLPSGQRDVTVFVHGYNATQAETAFRAAQLAHDLEVPGTLVIYSWPSRGKTLAYAYDNDSMLFARDGLEELLVQLKDTGADKIVLVAHSMGSALVMEAMRQMDIKNPGWPARNLGGVILISPDLNIDVFRSQMNRMSAVPTPFVVFISEKDKALNVSAHLRGTDEQGRLGNIKRIDRISEYPIDIVDTTAFSDDAASSHFVAATSPSLIAILNGARSINQTFGREDVSLERFLVGSDIYDRGAHEIVLRFAEEGGR